MNDQGPRYKWAVLLIACIGSMMAPLDSSIVSVTLPEMASGLHMDYAEVVWVPTAYLVTIAALLLSFGRMSDLRGRKSLYLIGFAIFTVASISCSLSQTGTQLIVSRVVQGIGGAFMMSVSPAIITATFPGKDRGKALGINAMFVYIGLSLGPPLGGILTDQFGWPAIFWVNVPIGVAVIAAGALVLREEHKRIEVHFDLSGAVLFAGTLVTLLVALTFGEGWGWGDLRIIALAIACVALFASFLKVERDKGHMAMLDLELFTKNRLFAAGNISALLNYTAFFGTSIVISFYLQRVLGMGLTSVGFVLLVMPLTMALAAPISGWLSDTIGSRLLATGGMLMIAAALLLLSTLTVSSDVTSVILFLLLLGLGMGLFSSPNTSSVMGCVRREQLGVASGTISTMRTVGQSLSLAIMGAVMALFSSTLVIESVFGGGTADVAAQDFVNGMHAAFLVASAIAVLGAIASSARPSGDQCPP